MQLPAGTRLLASDNVLAIQVAASSGLNTQHIGSVANINMQGVRTEHAGRYSCAAANSLGRATSNNITLDVKCE